MNFGYSAVVSANGALVRFSIDALIRLFAAAMLMALPTSGIAQTLWTAGTDDWNTPGNWTLGVPNSGSPTAFDAIIANGGTAQLQAPDGSVRRLRVGALGGDGNLLIDAGTLVVTDDLHVNEGGFVSSMTVRNGSTVTAPDTVIGFSGGFNSTFTLSGAGTTYNSTTSFIAAQAASGVGANVTVNDGAVLSSGTSSLGTGGLFGATVDGPGTRWSTTGAFAVGTGGNGTMLITNGATVHVGTALSINSLSDIQLNGGTIRFNTISGLNRLSYSAGTIQLAGNRDLVLDTVIPAIFGDPAVIPSGKALHVEGTTTIRQNKVVNVSGGALTSQGLLTVGQSSSAGGFLDVSAGGTVNAGANVNIDHFGFARISGAGSSLTVGGNLLVASASRGDITIQNGSSVYVTGSLALGSSTLFNFTGGSLRFNGYSRVTPTAQFVYSAGTIQLAGNRTVGSDAAILDFFGVAPNIPTGKALVVEGMATLTPSAPVTLSGGTFSASTVLMAPGSRLANTVNSQATGAMLALAGSVIDATGGDLTVGEASKVNGFYSAGTLQTGQSTVTLLDANDAVFDSAALVTIGNGGSPGTLAAPNGLTLDFGANLIGFGSIDSLDSATTPLTNNGHVTGNSVDEPLTLSGYVKGVGTFDNVSFTGTFSPGLSPTSLHVGNLALSNFSTLIMEVGGTAAGSGHDQLISSGTLNFDGTLRVSLINGFVPTAGQSFNLFDWLSGSGIFDSLQLPVLAGLVWNTSQLYANGTISLAAAGLPGDYNQNGTVDAADYTVWRNHLVSGLPLPNDDSPGVGQDDYSRWKSHFGDTSGSGSWADSATPTPEPASLMHVAIAMVLLAYCRSRHTT